MMHMQNGHVKEETTSPKPPDNAYVQQMTVRR
jgi:hypothetical protein